MAYFIQVDHASMIFDYLSKVQGTGQWHNADIPVNYVMISDHLDFMGMELRAINTQTSMANGDELVK